MTTVRQRRNITAAVVALTAALALAVGLGALSDPCANSPHKARCEAALTP